MDTETISARREMANVAVAVAADGVITITENTSFVGVLDAYQPVACYSVARRLRTAYEGPLVRVRRDDNAEEDIYFLADGSLDSSRLSEFAEFTDCWIRTRYDQSGNARHCIQTDTAKQNRLAIQGSLVTKNSRPSSLGFASDAAEIYTGSTIMQHVFAVAAFQLGAFSELNGIITGLSTPNGIVLIANGNSTTVLYDSHPAIIRLNGTATNAFAPITTLKVAECQLTTATQMDGVVLTQDRQVTSTRGWTGWMPEAIVFATSLSTTQATALRNNLYSYYGITP